MRFVAVAKRAVLPIARYSGLNRLLRTVLGRESVLILCYHGVVSRDYPGDAFLYRNTVSVGQFREHLEFLSRHFRLVSAADLWQSWGRNGNVRPGCALLTFDDGYRNNLTHAAPLLRKFGIPAMFAVTTDYIGRSDVLWPDEVNLRILSWPEATVPFPSPDGSTQPVPIPQDLRGRVRTAEQIRAVCKQLSEAALTQYLDRLRSVVCEQIEHRDRELFDFLSWDEVRELSAAGFEIASHTVSHPILTHIGAERLRYELGASKRRIEAELDKPCRFFVYPNGQKDDYSAAVEEAVRDCGYDLAFSATGSYAKFRSDPYAITRISVPGQQSMLVFESRASGLQSITARIL